MDEFLNADGSLKLNQDANNLKKPTTNEEIKIVISLATKNNSGADGFTAKLFSTFKNYLQQILLK